VHRHLLAACDVRVLVGRVRHTGIMLAI
jgi:hypothetical protein